MCFAPKRRPGRVARQRRPFYTHLPGKMEIHRQPFRRGELGTAACDAMWLQAARKML